MPALARRWTALHEALGSRAPADPLVRYREPHRAYHTEQHLTECLGWLDITAALAADPIALELAIWYHDAVYDPRRDDNERASADLARRELGQAGADPPLGAAVAELILWTTHRQPPSPGDAQLLVDIDLAILAAAPDRYAEYERQIHAEYVWLSEAEFRAGRAAILRAFLDRPALFSTPFFARRLEPRARRNLSESIIRLEDA